MYKVVERLKMIITQSNINIDNYQNKSFDGTNDQISNDYIVLNSSDYSPHGELSQIIQNFDKMNTKEITLVASNEQIINKEILSKNHLSILVDEVVTFIFKGLNEGKINWRDEKQVLNFFNNQDITSNEISYEIYNWLSNNSNNLNSIFLFGYFNFFGIETSKNYEEAFNLFINASKKNHILAQYYVGRCYEKGYGIKKNETLAFKYIEQIGKKDFVERQVRIGYYYQNGIGIKKDLKMAIYWYEKSAEQGHQKAQNKLAYIYENGNGIDKDINRAIYWYEKSAEQGNLVAQISLASIYKNGDGIDKDINKAIYWYEKSAEQGNQYAQYKLKELLKSKNNSCKIN